MLLSFEPWRMNKVKKLELTSNEIIVMDIFLNSNPCIKGCSLPEMQDSKKDCDECRLIKMRDNILNKLREDMIK